MSFAELFEKAWEQFSNCPYEIPLEMKPHLKQAIESAGFNVGASTGGGLTSTSTSTSSSSDTGKGKVKKLSGYNVFMREKMAELKADGVVSSERMGKVSAMWKECTEQQKDEWRGKATQLSGGSSSSTTTSKKVSTKTPNGTKCLSGYQFFVKNKMVDVKADTTIPSSERMAKLGALWKSLTDIEKEDWKVKAKTAFNSTN